MPTIDALDLAPFEGTVLAHERSRLDAGEPWCVATVAGLQFYSYGREDELIGRVLPQPGDPIALMRRPDNAADSRAVEVWWRNRFHLGHLPREVAYDLAPRMDEGKSCRAYVFDGGTGAAWSMRLVMIGAAVEPLHTARIARVAREREEEIRFEAVTAAELVWPTVPEWEEVPERERRGHQWRVRSEPRVPPTGAHRLENEAFESRIAKWHARRRRDAVEAFSTLPVQCPGADLEPDESLRGRRFPRWNDVPAWLMTKTQLREAGFKIRPDAKPFALKTGGHGPFALYQVRDAVPLRSVRDNTTATRRAPSYDAPVL